MIQCTDILGFLINYVHFTKCVPDRKDNQNARQTLPNIVLRLKGTPCDACTGCLDLILQQYRSCKKQELTSLCFQWPLYSGVLRKLNRNGKIWHQTCQLGFRATQGRYQSPLCHLMQHQRFLLMSKSELLNSKCYSAEDFHGQSALACSICALQTIFINSGQEMIVLSLCQASSLTSLQHKYYFESCSF